MKKSYLNLTSVMFGLSALSFNAFGANLSEIFKQSELYDPQLSVAKYTLDATTEGEKQAYAAFVPSMTLTFNKNLNKGKTTSSDSGPLPAVNSRGRGWGVSLSQSLYNHANYVNYSISKLQILKSSADFEIAYQSFILRVAQSYFDVLGAMDNLIFSKAEEKAIQRQLDQAEQRFEVGLAAITDVHEARARYDNARAAVIIANNQLEDNREALFEISQRYYDELATTPNELDYSTFKLSPMDVYQNMGMELSPELMATTIDKDIAEKQISLNKAAHYPTLDLSFSRTHNFSPGSTRTFFNDAGVPIQANSADSTSDGNSLGLSLTVPLFSGGATSSRVRQSVFQHKAAMDRFEQTRRSTVRQIRSAYHGTNAKQSSVQARKLAMISARSGLEATEAGYEVGTRTIVDVLNSQRSLYQAQRDYSQAKYDYFIQYLTLKRSAGTLAEQDIININSILK